MRPPRRPSTGANEQTRGLPPRDALSKKRTGPSDAGVVNGAAPTLSALAFRLPEGVASHFRGAVVAITGGGTGGHVYPALAVAGVLQSLGAQFRPTFVWIGSRRGIERSILEGRPFRYVGIPAGKFRRYFSMRNVTDAVRVGLGFCLSVAILARIRPAVLFSKGGYVSLPPLLAARLLRIPIVIHESDYDPGIATRVGARVADRILVSYEESRHFFPERVRSRVIVTGVPLRSDLGNASRERGNAWVKERGLSRSGNPPQQAVAGKKPRPLLLVLGGSQGSVELASLVWSVLHAIAGQWEIVIQTGRVASHATAGSDDLPPKDLLARPLEVRYLEDEYPDVLAAADCVLCRAGASTLWEAAVLAKAMVLVPLSKRASRGEQIRNADLFTSRGGALSVDTDSPGVRDELVATLHRLAADPAFREGLGGEASRICNPDADERIARVLLPYLKLRRDSD